jgi:hypothetical protein
MTAVSTSPYQPSWLACQLDAIGSWLQEPTEKLCGSSPQPLLTTNEIFASHYKPEYLEANPPLKALAERVETIKVQEPSTTYKVLWAVSVVLPILYGLGILLQKLALCDAEMQKIKENPRTAPQETSQELRILQQSLREFIEIAEKVGCKEVRDGPRDAQYLQRLDDQIGMERAHFLSRFKHREAGPAIEESTRTMLDLLEKHFKPNGGFQENSQDFRNFNQREREPDADLIKYLHSSLHYVWHDSTTNGPVTLFFSGGAERNYGQYWQYLVSRKERLIQRLAPATVN